MESNKAPILTGVKATTRTQQRLTVVLRLCFESPGESPTVKSVGFDTAKTSDEFGAIPETRKVQLVGGRTQAITHPHGGGYVVIENIGASVVQIKNTAIAISPKRVAFFEMTAAPMSLIAIDDSAVRLLFFPSLEVTPTAEPPV